MKRRIDELNSISTEYVDYDIETYFNVMAITEEQKEKRKKVAEDLWWTFVLVFAIIQAGISDGDLDYDYVLSFLKESLKNVVIQYAEPSDYLTRYVDVFSETMLNSTWDNLNFSNQDNYWTSTDRAMGLAVNEANSLENYVEYTAALRDGKKKKTWVAIIDGKTRLDHSEMDGETVPIDGYFKFPDCEMLYPHDEVNGTIGQCANCRCSLSYR